MRGNPVGTLPKDRLDFPVQGARPDSAAIIRRWHGVKPAPEFAYRSALNMRVSIGTGDYPCFDGPVND